MANKGITKSEVATAMTALASRGEKTTALAVRQELGNTGWMSTICKLMASIAKEAAIETPDVDATVPEVLQGAFQSALTTLWETAKGIASADIDAIRKSSAQRVETSERRFQDALESVFLLETELADCQSALAKSEVQNAALREENITLKAECSQLEQRCEDATARLDAYVDRFDAALAKLDGLHLEQGSPGIAEMRRRP
ncbi:MAG: DNA-binding protein [Thiogranum sp.]|nr:DNA-binding protein [Thiogranum sp.]